MLAVALHGELLEIGRKALQILLVGQHGDGLGAEEVVVPEAEQAHQHRQVALERRGAEMLVHLVEAVEHGAEIVRADGQHGREADGRIHGIAAADPIPEAEHVGGVDAELRDLFGIGRDGDEMLWRSPPRSPFSPASSQSRAVCALVMVSSVVKVLDETMNSVSAGSRSRTASAKSVPSTLETKRKVMARSL